MSADGSDHNPGDALAQRRTDLAEDRTILANERTYAGWMRTAFAAIGVGLGFRALFMEMQPPWLPRAIATLFLLIGIALFIAAERRAAWVVDISRSMRWRRCGCAACGWSRRRWCWRRWR